VVVIVVALARQHLARVSGAVEDILVQAFIPQLIIEAFDEPVLLGLARRDVTAGSAHVRFCAKADLVHQNTRTHPKRHRNLLHRHDRRVPRAAFDA